MKTGWKAAMILAVCLLLLPAAAGAATSGDWAYAVGKDGGAVICRYGGRDAEVTVPAELDGYPVTVIGTGAFSMCGAVSVVIPDSVTEIRKEAFADCWSLERVVIPDSVTEIPDRAFASCAALAEVRLPANLTRIGAEAFAECYALTALDIPSGVTAIGDDAFVRCRALTCLTIPAGVTALKITGFFGCSALSGITVAEGNPAFRSADGALLSADGTRLLLCPAGKTGTFAVPAGVTAIGEAAFYGCAGLTEVTLPDGVAVIGADAFHGCGGLTALTLPASLTAIGEAAFYGCAGLTEIVIPDRVESIGRFAFGECLALSRVTLPAGVTAIGPFAFTAYTESAGGRPGYGPIPGLTVTVVPGSDAEAYCTENELPFGYGE